MMRARRIPYLLAAAATTTVALTAGCTINPVTGERQLALVTAEDEVAIGRQQYQPSQQMQGGEYVADPALTAYVRAIGNRLAAVSDRALPYEFVIINSSVPNAWALPGGKIAINRGLILELQSEAELAAVLAHEIVHAAARHGAQAMQRGILLQGAVAVAGVAARNSDYSGLAVGAASLGAQLVHMRHGRDAELEADAYGMRYMSAAGYEPRAAIDLQQTFVRLSEGGDSGGWLAGLFASHPPSVERVAANRATAATLPMGGTLGREAYLSATANLRRDAPGYAALDSAARALSDRDLAVARREAGVAAERIPREARVQTVLGDIEMASGQPESAIARYEQALGLNDRFFYTHLAKGKAHLELAQFDQAETAFDASLALLPTADAHLGLGRIAESRGEIALALEHYGEAAESSGAAGAEARLALTRLDLPQNPGRYLSAASSLDANGQLIVEITNSTELAVAGIELIVSYRTSGQVGTARRALDAPLAPGARRRLATGLGPFTSSADYEVVVDRARLAEAP